MAHSVLVKHIRRIIRQLCESGAEGCLAEGEKAKVDSAIAGRVTSHARRKFLQQTAVAGVAVGINAIAPKSSWAFASAAAHQANVVVVGAGLAGLNAAYQLKKAGVPVSLYEASGRVGGRVFSKTGGLAPELVVEIGAELINSDHADMLALVDELGLSLFNRYEDAATLPYPTAAYYFENRQISELELAHDLQRLAMQLAEDAARLDEDYDLYASQFDALSAKAYLDQHAEKIQKTYLWSLLADMMRTEYGVELHESSALQLLFMLITVDGDELTLLGYSDEMYSINGGNSLLPEALADKLESELFLNSKLRRISKPGKKFLLEFECGGVTRADFVILAMPFSALRKVEIDVHLPKTLRKFIQTLNLGRNEKVFAGVSSKAWRQPQGFTMEAWSDLGFSEAWDGSQSQINRMDGALTFFLGGDDTAVMPLGAEKVAQLFVGKLNAQLDGVADALTGHYQASRWSKNSLTQGAYSSFKPGQLTEFSDYFWIESDDEAERQDVAIGRLLFAGEQVSDAFYGFMNGGAETGRLAAEHILRKLGALSVTEADLHQDASIC